MRIRTQFIITMLLFGIILAFIAALAVITHQRMEKTGAREDLAAAIAQGASDLSYLANDYLIYRESQQLRRWQSRFESFSKQVAGLNADKPDQQALVRNIQANQQRLKEVFDSTVSALGSSSSIQRVSPDLAFFQVSWSRMAVQNQGLVSDASRLSQLLHRQMDQLTETRTVLIYVIVGLFGAFLLVSYMLTYRRILKSIETLQAGTAVIGSGNLDFKIEEKKNDEIGDLSHAFNRMTADLKSVTASKAELERESAERKHAEGALRESEEKFRSAFANAAIGFAMTMPDGRFVDANSTYCAITGYSVEELWTLAFPQLIHPDDRAANMRLMERLFSGEIGDFGVENRYVRKDGLPVWVRKSVSLVRNAQGSPQWTIVLIEDISKHKEFEVALRESEQRLKRAQEIAHLGSWELDLINDRLSWSDEVYRIFGLQPQEFSATYEAFLEAVHPDDRAAVDAAYSGSVREGRDTYEIEHRIVRRSTGEIRIVHERCEHIRDMSGRIILSVGMVHDITDRKRAEEALRQQTLELQLLTEALEMRVQERTAELANANEALRNLSSRLLSAHEEERKRVAGEIHDVIGACLGAIKFKVEGALRSSADGAPHPLTDSLKVVIPVIQEGIEECRRIQQDLRPSMLDDLGLLPTLSWFCRRFQTIYSGIRVEQLIAVSEEEIPGPRKIVLYRVTQEAMNNIAKHSKADLVRLGLQKADGRIQLSIEDNGKGFDVGHALVSESTRRGLGLTSMKERVEFSGGSFQVESVEGKGTTIRASWPI